MPMPNDLVSVWGNLPPYNPYDPRSLRQWWQKEVLAKHGKYSSYAILLLLPNDREALNFFIGYGEELDLISDKNCLVMLLSTEYVLSSAGFDKQIWEMSIIDSVAKGYSKKVAELFGITPDKAPCLIVFDDIRSSKCVVVSLKMGTEEIGERMRTVFSIIQQAVSSNENPLEALENHLIKKRLLKTGQAIVGYATKTLEAVMGIWMKAYIDSYYK